MSKLQQLLNLNVIENIKHKVIITNRIKDEDGKSLEFTIKPISFHKLNDLKKRATTFDKKGNPILNDDILNSLIIIESTINPNFKDAESIDSLKCSTPEQYLNKILLAGEIEKLLKNILSISGFENDFEQVVEQVKN